jgi:hypothetical protein
MLTSDLLGGDPGLYGRLLAPQSASSPAEI